MITPASGVLADADKGDVVLLAGSTGRVGGDDARNAGRAGATISNEVAADRRDRVTVLVADRTNFNEGNAAVRTVVERFGRLDDAISLAGGRSAWGSDGGV